MAITNLGEKFAQNVVRRYYETAVTPSITNQDWEGTIKGSGADRLNMLTLSSVTISDYTKGTDMTLQTIGDIEDQLIVNQQKSYYWGIDDIDKFEAYVNDYEGSLVQDAGNKLAESVDAYVLGMAEFNVAAGNQIGSDYVLTGVTTSNYCTITNVGSVTITSAHETGSVDPVGAGFTSSMVGKGLTIDNRDATATLSTVWYRITNWRSTLQVDVINEDEAYDVTNGFLVDGNHGGDGCGVRVATGVDAVTVSKDNIVDYVLAAKEALDRSKAPKTGRWLVVDSWLASKLLKAPELIPAVATAYDNVVTKGLLGEIMGFRVYQNEGTSGTTTTSAGGGTFYPFGTKDWITFAMAMTESGIEDINKQFGKAYKGLSVYGAKVARERRKCGGYIFAKSET